ncbi:MAG: alpha-L-fucosidase [Terriglobia bacterium]
MRTVARRAFLGTLAGAAFGGELARASQGAGQEAGAAVELPRPNAAQLAWQNFEVGVLYSVDIPVFATGGFRETRSTFDPQIYNPRKLSTDQWLETARALGARYAVFTATHHGGFLQWQSDLYPYGLKQTRWRKGKGDLVSDFIDSCHRHRVKPGLFMSCFANSWWKVSNYRVNWGQGGTGQRAYNRMFERMVEELCSRYGALAEIWFDAGLLSPREGGPDVLPIVEKYQSDTVFYHSPRRAQHRWIGNENGIAGVPCWATMPCPSDVEQGYRDGSKALLATGDPNGKWWSPGMADVPIRNHDWFWKEGHENRISPLPLLVERYYASVGRNCNYILGATPDPDGLIPDADLRRFGELGAEIRRRFSKPLAETRGHGTTLELALRRPAHISQLVLMEDIAWGERIRRYVIERLAPGNTWEKVCEGTSVGHKRIERFPPLEAARVRLRCTESRATPRLAQFAVYGPDSISFS